MKETNIEWCDSTINGSSGCDGCELWNSQRKSCYAGITHERRWAKSLAVSHPQFYSPSFDVVKMIPGRFARAAAWSDLRGKDRPDKPWLNGLPRMIFVGDMGDFLSRNVTDEFLINELFGAMTSEQGRRHFWLLLTKQIVRLRNLSKRMKGGLPDNCMAMTTATDQRTFNARIYALLDTECKWRGLSCEPLLGKIDMGRFTPSRSCVGHIEFDKFSWIDPLTGERMCDGMNEPAIGPKIDLVIAGAESGTGHDPLTSPRATDPAFLRLLRDQCFNAAVPFFFKQWGAWFPADQFHVRLFDKVRAGEHTYCGEQYMMRAGKVDAGANLDGMEWHEMPILGNSAGVPAGESIF